MGQCGSAQKEDGDVQQNNSKPDDISTDPTHNKVTVESAPSHTIATSSTPSNGTTTATSTANGSTDIDTDFRETVKLVTLMILDRLSQALEFEKEAFHELSVKRGKHNYMELIGSVAAEKFLRDILNISPSEPNPSTIHLDRNDISYEQHRFVSLLHIAQTSEFRSALSRAELSKRLQSSVKAMQHELELSANASDSSDLKIHLKFFAHTMTFAQGEISTQQDLLYKNIEEICKQ